MAGNLIIPRVEVYWGETNLTSYNGDGNYPKGEPVVFKVECSLPSQSDNPSASMMLAPTQGAYEIYNKLVLNNPDDQIVTTFGYLGKKKVSMVWMWGGEQISYGNTMGIRITLLSELSGLINSTTRSVANNQDKAMTMLNAIKDTEKFYALENYKVVKYSETASNDLQKSKILSQYSRDTTFVSTINNIVRENGNYVYSTNIVSEAVASDSRKVTGNTETASKLVIFTPFTHEGSKDTVVDGAKREYNEYPDPTKRYGYLIGPSIINSIERTFRWAPPQQISTPTPAKAPVPRGKKAKDKARTPAQEQQNKAASEKGAVQNNALAASHPGISVAEDKVGPQKQILQQQEAAAQLSFSTFLVPALVGLKPYDILYIPSLNAKTVNDIEDWIVTSVDYNQTDGGVDISVNATRTYGLPGTLMNPASGKKFLEQAQKLKTLEDWEKYAWGIQNPPSESDKDSFYNLPALPPQIPFSLVATPVDGGKATKILDPNFKAAIQQSTAWKFLPGTDVVQQSTRKVEEYYYNFYLEGR